MLLKFSSWQGRWKKTSALFAVLPEGKRTTPLRSTSTSCCTHPSSSSGPHALDMPEARKCNHDFGTSKNALPTCSALDPSRTESFFWRMSPLSPLLYSCWVVSVAARKGQGLGCPVYLPAYIKTSAKEARQAQVDTTITIEYTAKLRSQQKGSLESTQYALLCGKSKLTLQSPRRLSQTSRTFTLNHHDYARQLPHWDNLGMIVWKLAKTGMGRGHKN